MSEILCKKCRAPIPPTHIEPDSTWVSCAECFTLFEVPSARPSETAGASMPDRPQRRLRVPMPARINVEHVAGNVIITRTWRTIAAFVMIPFTLFWNGFMVVWFSIALSQGQWMMAIFGSLHGAVGVFLLFSTAAQLLNTTTITVGNGVFKVAHGPVPWAGALEIDAREIDQLYCHEKVRSTKNGQKRTYELHASLQGGIRTKKLVSGLPEAEQALFLEQELERHLSIEDRPMAGAYVG